MKNIFFIILILGIVSCESNEILPTFDSSLTEMESEVRSTPIVDLGPENPNPDNPHQLCIGCGCQNEFNSCMGTNCHPDSYGPHVCCVHGQISEGCCKENRRDCHRCNFGFICFRWSIFHFSELTPSQQDSVNNGQVYFSLGDLTSAQIENLEPYRGTVEKWQDGTPLTDQDYAILDQDLDEF